MTLTSAYTYNDGGRADAGYKGLADDCTTRAIAIGTGMPYQVVYDLVNAYGARERRSKHRSSRSGARTGVHIPTIRRIMAELGWQWTPTMLVGQGCKVHLRADELPSGNLIVSVSRHMVAMIDGVIHDNHDPSRGGKRCVYGYYCKPDYWETFDNAEDYT